MLLYIIIKMIGYILSLMIFSQPQQIAREGQICGGFMPVEMISNCADTMDCVYTFGPMIADAPGTCRPGCPTVRDQWGNCVPDNCEIWDDGCNSCIYHSNNNTLEGCTENICYTVKHQANCERYSTNVNDFFQCSQYADELDRLNQICCTDNFMCLNGFPSECSPECASLVNLLFTNCNSITSLTGIQEQKGWIDFHSKCLETSGIPSVKNIPTNCAVWFDGCNTCQVTNGEIQFCSKRMCLTMNEPSCQQHHLENQIDIHEEGRECFDGLDNDGDGLSDCDDPDCAIFGRCRRIGGIENGRECFDGLDNDGDGLTDCDDPDCVKDPRASIRCPELAAVPISTPLRGMSVQIHVDSPVTINGH